MGILDFGILGRSRGCTTRQFGDGAWRSEARIPPGLPLGATSKPTVSNRVGARKQIEHFFRGQNPTKSQKNPDFQPRGQNFTKSQKNQDFQPRGNFIAMNFLAQINVDYPGRRPQAPACFKYLRTFTGSYQFFMISFGMAPSKSTHVMSNLIITTIIVLNDTLHYNMHYLVIYH